MYESDKIKRAIAFYFSVALFIILLPIVLSYSLGYKIDYGKLRIYKTGIISIKTNPAGANIYVNGRAFKDLSPSRIEELKPGSYNIEVKKDGFYPWQKELSVKPNMVTQAEDIVLFPVAKDIKRIGECETVDFFISDRNDIFYMTKEGLFKSNMDGDNFRKISAYSEWPDDIIDKKVSLDGRKILFFDKYHIWIAHLNVEDNTAKAIGNIRIEKLLDSISQISDVFWYSDSRHIIFVTDKDINAAELSGGALSRNVVTLYRFVRNPSTIYYDDANDSLYFIDFGSESGPQQTSGSKNGTYIYRLDLRQRFLDNFIQRFMKGFDTGNEKR
ncbi:MAG: PEGA domain-containing protein [Candidatus Omnitrophica bacterium]|nr:PEGA domain-containing protein [Candidatus Omnitrophota bacterium]